MDPLNHILVTTDFSEGADLAIRPAVELAARAAARLTLLHVVEPGFAAKLLPDAKAGAATRHATDEAQRTLDKTANAHLGVLPNASTVVVVDDDPVRAVTDYARDHDVDLVVIATHGRTGWRRLILGSVTEKVVAQAPCAVLAVRAP